ncbi:glutamine-fructose-6-phosphate transaminase (isomerizing) [Acididesulfobacillus acetoxydans]|uniref:Glutamine--fructose-6-phosphate aminotransferase [isomerizing] n=1 Tax=Acididesulfobacillus acetoxydans TaxID=1561005 RepID=A0A8S0VW29_9FIRM|nr:glutamine--fructose-6-phosphate transaminase (isomerizing) [Acididesulfobacillus acetoxydans]CAA7600353.1 glutamine-fructose-6-phosphate transaminase (isomerizing) [Acididesulfobacillus acetoxydans]CEJ07875.1 Glutamine--fructose-6-phosphate aminotransferase [isomerizing] [Acididesulfobacillus acetoxydans]
MCGIVGYIGRRPAVPILVKGLKKLEYRGYDSAGVAVLDEEDGLFACKSVGKLAALEEKLGDDYARTSVGIGHTRWATHGRPSDLNAHPHQDCTGEFAVVHNGIIENYLELRDWLSEQGHRLISETDTEVLPHLVEHFYAGDLAAAVRQVLTKIRGAFALVVLSRKDPDRLVAARKDSPLVVGLGDGEFFVASDIPAVLDYTRKTYILADGEMAVVSVNGVKITDFQGNPREKEVFEVKWDAVAAEKGGYEHFMLKEIHEQPRALKDTLLGRLTDYGVELQEVDLTAAEVNQFHKVYIVACGTASHAGLVGKNLIERWARMPVEVDIASEFRYRRPLIDEHTLVVVISQSGETADTLAALREAHRLGARVVAVTNVVGSSVAREADDVIYTWAGPEIAVASTKAYTTQLLGMVLLGLYLAEAKGTMPAEKSQALIAAVRELPRQAQEVLDQQEVIKKLAQSFIAVEDTFFIGRGLDWAVAMEGALKLKEISYIHAEAYAAGELKHGTLALITEETPVIGLATQRGVYEKTISNIKEVKARDAKVIGLTFAGNKDMHKSVDQVVYLPETLDELAPILTVIPLQLLAYYVSVARGCDVDKPRNLAKSVTVE